MQYVPYEIPDHLTLPHGELSLREENGLINVPRFRLYTPAPCTIVWSERLKVDGIAIACHRAEHLSLIIASEDGDVFRLIITPVRTHFERLEK